MNFLESSEDYLETILVLTKTKQVVRSIDIANDMGFSKPSVSIAMKKLVGKKLILISKDGHISLTKKGKDKAQEIYDRHCLLAEILKKIGVSDDVAYADACKIEHDISEETFECLKRIVK